MPRGVLVFYTPLVDGLPFYARYGFVALLDDPHHMYLAVTSIAAAFGEGESPTASR